MGVGHSNTSITTKQLFALGWNAGDADAEFAESVSVRNINLQIAKTGEFSLREAREALAALPQPWAVKDPRFCKTLQLWLPAMAPYEPLLLWVRKDLDAVRDSYRRRGKTWRYVDRLFDRARDHFENWPWANLAIDVERIAETVALFDLSRTQPGMSSQRGMIGLPPENGTNRKQTTIENRKPDLTPAKFA